MEEGDIKYTVSLKLFLKLEILGRRYLHICFLFKYFLIIFKIWATASNDEQKRQLLKNFI